MDASASTSREEHLEAVHSWGDALEFVPARYKADREIVLAAVQQNGSALGYAAEECKADHEIVMAAVQQNWQALYFAAEECQEDREIAMAAVHRDHRAILCIGAGLKLDSTFAPEAKRRWCILKLSMLSGQSTVVVAYGHESAEDDEALNSQNPPNPKEG
eukprot:5585369-Amphidinium_carterae.1